MSLVLKYQTVTPAGSGAKRPKRKALPLRYRRWPRLVFAACVLASIGTAGHWFWQTGLLEKATLQATAQVVDISARLGFAVQDILVSGRHRTDKAALLAALEIQRGTPSLTFDPNRLRAQVEGLAWVREAKVERRLPDTVVLHIVEREPIALWQSHGHYALVDTEGVVIDGISVTPFAHLPLVVGEDAPAHVPDLLALLAQEPEIARRITAAVRVGERRWNLDLDGRITVRLPEENTIAAWHRFIDYQREHDLLSRDIAVIDLRLPGRTQVRLRQAPGEEKQQPPQETRGA
ncbi:MAG: cell division protein FtsQ/DivIB [Magnetospiraceae bacterium]